MVLGLEPMPHLDPRTAAKRPVSKGAMRSHDSGREFALTEKVAQALHGRTVRALDVFQARDPADTGEILAHTHHETRISHDLCVGRHRLGSSLGTMPP